MNTENEQIRQDDPIEGPRRTRLFSLISLVLGIAAAACAFSFGLLSPILGGLGIVVAAISRKNLDYYDGITIAGLVLSIIGTAVGTAMFVLDKTGILEEIVYTLFG